MSEIEKRARELLAAEYERFDLPSTAAGVRDGGYDLSPSMRALVAALTPPEGYALVPVEPTPEMLQAAAFGVARKTGQKFNPMMSAGYAAMLAARPGVF
ncbi:MULTISPECIES: hypothetical protein [unclassified Stenotrophomonas]|jgi:hypothetical protein|uniref:hypothetical protein n=1 Tax=unclassified Stenotrophomonas TaxID=196198 RepID=UPI0019A54CC1|nr:MULTISPECIES: hypothetical protein [unclassified Stenotrophomonas]MBD3825613.1 hypothetical protein [Stenotrophomonas sp.]